MWRYFLIPLFFSSYANAYFGSCGEDKSAEEIFTLEDVKIFKGQVVKAWLDQRDSTWYVAANFKLYEVFKGNVKKDDVVRSQTPGHIGGPNFMIAQTYLFVVDQEGVVDPCLTKPYHFSSKIFEQLSKLKYDELRKLRRDS